MLNNATIGENGTIYIKLTDAQKQSLADKPITIKITDKNVDENALKELFGGFQCEKIQIFRNQNVSIFFL